MEGDGPTKGTPRKVGKIISGIDGIAVDAACALLLGFGNPRDIKLIALAEKRGRVKFDLDDLRAEGPSEVIQDFVHPSTYTVNSPGAKSRFTANHEKILEIWTELSRVKPTCEETLCTQCGDCSSACPSGAIQLQPYPKIDPEKCLSCFCCVEACGEKALAVPQSDEILEKRRQVGM
jgi:ferredoxin